jgi:hypothetical protein
MRKKYFLLVKIALAIALPAADAETAATCFKRFAMGISDLSGSFHEG